MSSSDSASSSVGRGARKRGRSAARRAPSPRAAPPHVLQEEKLPCGILAGALGYEFKNAALLEQAMTHSSTFGSTSRACERLEFLGDRVLGLVIAEHLHAHFPDEREGDLSRRFHGLVSQSALAKVARRLSLDRYLRHGLPYPASFSAALPPGAPRVLGSAPPTEAMLADCTESMFGAIFLDGGWDAVRAVALRVFAHELRNPPKRPPLDPKTRLQEWSLERHFGLPKYLVLSREGPDHEPLFLVRVSLSESACAELRAGAEGAGASRRLAERSAAQALLSRIDKGSYEGGSYFSLRPVSGGAPGGGGVSGAAEE